MLTFNLALIINVVEKRPSKTQSYTRILLRTNDEFNVHKVYRGYTILPLSKFFWNQCLRHKQLFQVKETTFFKPSASFKIEDRYATLIDKRGFSKYKDLNLTKTINLCFNYKM